MVDLFGVGMIGSIIHSALLGILYSFKVRLPNYGQGVFRLAGAGRINRDY